MKQLKNEAFVRDFLQKWSFEDQKRSISARLPLKLKLWSSKTKLFCETSFKNEALKIKNETFVRDFLQKWSFEAQKRSFSARLPSKMKLWRSKTKHFCETSFKNHMLTGHLTSEFQYVLTIFKWMLQKYSAPATKKLSRGIRSPVTATRNDHCKVRLPWHENCNLSTNSASEASNIDIAKHEILAPATRNASFRSLFKSTTPASVFATLTYSCACHAFWNVSKSLRLPREKHFEPQKVVRDRGVLTILTSKSCWRAGVVQILPTSTSKSAPRLSVFYDFDFQIVLARRRGANFADFNFQKCSEAVSFLRFWLPNRSRAQAWCKFCRLQLPKVLSHPQFLTILTSKSFSRAGVVQILSHLGQQILRTRPFLGPDFASRRSHKTMEKHSISRTSYPPNPHVQHRLTGHIGLQATRVT